MKKGMSTRRTDRSAGNDNNNNSNNNNNNNNNNIINDDPVLVQNQFGYVKPFNGFKDDVSEWLDDFERIAIFNGWEDDKKKVFFCLSMKGAAKQWLNTIDGNINYEGLINQFKLAFTPIGAAELNERRLNERKCSKGETVGEYYYSILDLCKRVDNGMSESSKKQYFIRGLPYKIKEYVIAASPKTLEKAYQKALKKEYALNAMKDEYNYVQKNTKFTNNYKNYNNNNKYQNNKHNNSNNHTKSNDTTKKKFTGNCNYCGIVGHKEKDCYKKKNKDASKSKSNLNHIEDDKLPSVMVKLGGINVHGMLDSGSSRTIVDSSLVSICENNGIRKYDGKGLKSATNHIIPVVGVTTMTFELGGSTCDIDVCIVKDFQFTLLIGLDTMSICKMEISFDKNYVSIVNGDAVVLNPSKPKKEPVKQTNIEDVLVVNDNYFSPLSEMIEEYSGIFAHGEDDPIGHCSKFSHSINTGTNKPIRSRPYRYSFAEDKIMDEFIAKMLYLDIIERSSSPWSSPVVLVKKKNGTHRFCVDYRKLNELTIKDVYPLPIINDALSLFNHAEYFTTLDLASGFWQIPMKEEDKIKTAFITKHGLYQFKVMPFGLCNAPSTFQRTMDIVLEEFLNEFCMVYIDDIIIFSKSFDDHMKHLKMIFDKLQSEGFQIKYDKCQFARQRISYLGHIISNKGIEMDDTKVKSIVNFPVPQNTSELRRFLGLSGYYRRFIENFSLITSPLNNLMKANVPYLWNDECQTAFIMLKDNLTGDKILRFPNFKLPFILKTDASTKSVAAILSQSCEEGEYVVCYASRSINKHERNYSATELECLALKWAIKHFRQYLYGTKFTVYTDHYALKWLMNNKDNNAKLSRWALALQEFDFEVIHKQGKQNIDVDALSRVVMVLNEENAPLQLSDTLISEQLKDVFTAAMIKYKLENIIPEEEKLKTKVLTQSEHFTVENDLLCHLLHQRGKSVMKRIVLPHSMIATVMEEYHDTCISGGHLGFHKTYEKVRERFYWENMYSDIMHYIKTCKECCRNKSPNMLTPGKMTPIVVSKPFEIVGVDVCGPITKTNAGNKYIVVFSDYFTKWVEAFAVPDQQSSTIAKLLINQIITRHGAPEKLLSDQGKPFLSKLIKSIYSDLGIKKIQTTAYHPQTDGIVERFNRTMIKMLNNYVSEHQKDWDLYLDQVLFAYRTSCHASTGYSPFFMLYGREPILMPDVAFKHSPNGLSDVECYLQDRKIIFEDTYTQARVSLDKSHLNQKKNYDKKRSAIEFNVGDKIWLYTPKTKVGLSKKFHRHWDGPFIIVEKLNAINYKVKNMNNERNVMVVHISRMKLYSNADYNNQSEEKEDDVYEVESILDTKTKENTIYYFVKFIGFDNRHNKWIPASDLHAEDLLEDFHRRKGTVSPSGSVMT